MKVLWFILLGLLMNGLKANQLPIIDTAVIDTSVKTVYHSPKKATILAATLPGAGQIYNRKYWKAPIVWGILGYATYSLVKNQQSLTDRNNQFKTMYANGQTPTALQRSERDQIRINRDVSIITLSVVYVLQIIDATVDAHFYKFDINQSLSFQVQPAPSQLLSFTYTLP